jgi:hypothetical protein
LLNGLELLMESPVEVAGPCNLGNPHEIPVREIADLILGQTKSRSKIEHRPLPQDDPKRRQPVITRARELLGWSPRVALEEGLRTTIDYFSLRLSSPAVASSLAAARLRIELGNGKTQHCRPVSTRATECTGPAHRAGGRPMQRSARPSGSTLRRCLRSLSRSHRSFGSERRRGAPCRGIRDRRSGRCRGFPASRHRPGSAPQGR